MELGDGKMFLTPRDLFDAYSGALDNGDDDLSQFLFTRLTALWVDMDKDSSNLSSEDDLDNQPAGSNYDEVFGTNVGLIEIPFGKKDLIERVAGCICVGRSKGEEVGKIIEQLVNRRQGIEPELTPSQKRTLDRIKQREKFDGRPPYLRPVPSQQQ